ncbi:MAG: hypothetical protein WAR24_00825, partial [Candidatus Acidiferrales bacterium]
MKWIEQACRIKVRVYLALIGIAFVLGTAVSAGAQEKQEPPTLAVAGQATTDDATTGIEKEAGRPILQRRNPRYQLCKGDTFDLTFPFTPEFN